MKTLLIMRHAKSSWDDSGVADHDRPLTARGERDAPRMGKLLRREGVVPQTLGLEEPDPACTLDHVIGSPRAARPRISLSTSLGFGGCNAALVLEAADR